MLAQAIEAEVAEFLAEHAEKRDAAGRTRLVRNGHLPERTVQTGIGAVTVKAPRCGSGWAAALCLLDSAALPAADQDAGGVVAVELLSNVVYGALIRRRFADGLASALRLHF